MKLLKGPHPGIGRWRTDIDSGVLALGMEIVCSHCEQSTWFSLEEIANKLKCPRCLREFDFPATAPHKTTWSYKVQGPFAIEDYAQGAYSVAFALHFLTDKVSHELYVDPQFQIEPSKWGAN